MACAMDWEVLGVTPAADLATIRRAYARKLRQHNPEDDPEGFMALRAAYEAAVTAASPSPTDVISAPPAGDQRSENAATLKHWQLVQRVRHALAAGLEDAEVERRVLAVLDSAAMAEIGVWAATEQALLDLFIALPSPARAVEASARRFSWRERSYSTTPNADAAQVLGELDSRETLKAVRQPGHAYHEVFTALCRPLPESRRERRALAIMAPQACTLLTLIADSPAALSDLDHDTVGWMLTLTPLQTFTTAQRFAIFVVRPVFMALMGIILIGMIVVYGRFALEILGIH